MNHTVWLIYASALVIGVSFVFVARNPTSYLASPMIAVIVILSARILGAVINKDV